MAVITILSNLINSLVKWLSIFRISSTFPYFFVKSGQGINQLSLGCM
jgi:hypothetical protein